MTYNELQEKQALRKLLAKLREWSEEEEQYEHNNIDDGSHTGEPQMHGGRPGGTACMCNVR